MALVLSAVTAFGQGYPLPTNGSAVCTGCPGRNVMNQLNDGLALWPWASPIKGFVGRYVDSVYTADNQGMGMRTARAGRVKVAAAQRGTAPPRVYVQVGAALSAYKLDTFFSQKLPAGLVNVDAYATGISYYRPPKADGSIVLEKVLMPEAFVYPESPMSGWQVETVDSQERLFDWDWDDRGYVYAAYSIFGWGVIKDDGKTDGGMLQKISQRKGDLPPEASISSKSIAVLKTSSGAYYTVLSDPESGGLSAVYNVTDPANPGPASVFSRPNQGVRYWAKNAAGNRFAFVDKNFNVQVYDVDTFVTGGNPIVSFSPSTGNRKFFGVAGDNQGNFWGIESTGSIAANVLWRFSPSGGSYTPQSFDVYGEAYSPLAIESNDGYLTITGFESGTDFNGTTQAYDPRVYKIDSTGPKPIELNNFFKNYYHNPPSGYAKPDGYTRMVRGVVTVKVGSKVYLIYAAHGLGDVYELVAGDSVTLNRGASFGTPNPRSQASQSGPFYGDPATYTAVSSTTGFALPVMWDFANPEYPGGNAPTSTTGQAITHQFGGLSTATQITTPRTVTVKLTNDPSVFDTTTVTLKVPTPRVTINGTSTVITAGSTGHELVAGDTFADASDGSIESHYNVWTIGATTTSGNPTVTPAVGAIGPQTLTFTANYGPYNGSSLAPLSPASYVAQIANIGYTVKPFVVQMATPTSNGNNFTFKATARKTSDQTVILPTATTWSVTWTMKKNGADVVPPQTTAAAGIGTIPDFVVSGVSAASFNGATLEVSATIADASLSAAAQPYKTDSASTLLNTPDPVITQSGCANTGSPCSFTVSSPTDPTMAGWQYSWTLSGPTGTISGSGATFSPAISAPGTHTVSLTVTKSIFSASATPIQFTAAGSLCGPVPTANQMYISVNGGGGCTTNNSSNCPVGTSITFKAQPNMGQYTPQGCDTYSWNFGDGQTATGLEVSHAFTSASPVTVTLTVSNSTGGSVTLTKSISFGGGGNPNPNPTCTAPTGVTFSYAGNLGCGLNLACKTGETITFVANRTGGIQSNCDTVTWSFGDGSNGSGSSVNKVYTSASSFIVSASISNSAGTGVSPSQTIPVETASQGGGSCTLPRANLVSFTWIGAQSNCSQSSTQPCTPGENVEFTARVFSGQFTSCNRFEWDFGDGTGSAQQNPTHAFPAGQGSYTVKLRVYSDTETLPTISRDVQFTGGTPAKPVPVVRIITAPSSAGKNTALTFTAESDLPTTTGWTWDFGDGQRDTSQASAISQTSTVTHSFSEPRTYIVTVTARNSESGATAQTGRATRELTIVSTPTHRFLLPVVSHLPGQNNSMWRTDVQVFHADPSVSASNPLVMTVEFKGETKQINIDRSTYIAEDFMTKIKATDDSGPVIVSVQSDYRPQIWTRTYNQATSGTFGQFIPAILLSDSSSAVALPTTETMLYLPGLRSGGRYRTNLGLVNPMPAKMNVTVTAYTDDAKLINSATREVKSFDLLQFNVADVITGLPTDKPYTVRVTVPANNWLVAYGSMLDQASNDPTYVSAIAENELLSADYGDLLVPGVGKTGLWTSDVTIFNPGVSIDDAVVVDLAYYAPNGDKTGEAKNIRIEPRQLLQINKLLDAGVLSPQPAPSVGVLRVKTVSGWTTRFPLAYSRTYNDNGAVTFGQGIPAFAAPRANVRATLPAVIPALRDDTGENGYYTNLGLVNVTDKAVRVRVTLLSESNGASVDSLTYDLNPYASQIGRFPLLTNAVRGTLKIEIVGTGSVWAYASVIDKKTTDPEYVAAVPMQ